MARTKLDLDVFAKLGQKLGVDIDETSQGEATPDEPWAPSLTPTQQLIFDSPARYILAYGERASGKSTVGVHKSVRHAYENFNALALYLVGVQSQATQGGIFDKLVIEVLPQWEKGMGLEWEPPKRDTQNQLYVHIKNRWGGWSKITLMSAPHGPTLKERIRGYEPSFVLVDEITGLNGDVYFSSVVQQIGRRQGIDGPQQYYAACNPDGPSHWVYKRFFEIPYEESRNSEGEIISPEGEWDDRYKVFHIPISENKHNLPEGYYDTVIEATKNDPIEYQRMVLGKWIDRPDGSAIFADHFFPDIHVLQSPSGLRVKPNPKRPCVLGYDLGQTSNAIIFMQPIMTVQGLSWVIFDEMIYNQKKLPYETLVQAILKKQAFWEEICGTKFKWSHVSDNSAFNQYRAGSGSYDVLDVERYSKKYCDQYGLPPIRMVDAPKFQGSVEARVRLTMTLLREERLFVSNGCTGVRQMFLNLQMSPKKTRGDTYDPSAPFKPKRSVHLHPFDAMSYVLLHADLQGVNVGGSKDAVEIIEMEA